MNISTTPLPDLLLIEPRVFTDSRGFFMETYQARECAQAGIHADFVQDNQFGSSQGVLRGLHYQMRQGRENLSAPLLA